MIIKSIKELEQLEMQKIKGGPILITPCYDPCDCTRGCEEPFSSALHDARTDALRYLQNPKGGNYFYV